MNSIPLVRNNSVNDINTSLIALRNVLRELTETTSDVNKEIEKYVLKSDVVNVVESDNDNPVTSGAVYDKVTNTINSLDVSTVGGSGKYISAISETDGKISATASDIDTTVTSGSNNPVTSGGVYNALEASKNTFTFYQAGYTGLFVISVPLTTIATNDTILGTVLINSRWGDTYYLSFYSQLNDTAFCNVVYVKNANYTGIHKLEEEIRWDKDTTNNKIYFYLKSASTNGRILFTILSERKISLGGIEITTSTNTTLWDNAQYSSGFITLELSGNRSLPETKGGDEETEEEKTIEEEPKEEER